MTIEAFASQPHYASHLVPIWSALPGVERGIFWAAGMWGDQPNTEGAASRRPGYPPPTRGTRVPTMVAGYADEVSCTQSGRPVIYLEHGAGQTYDGDRRGNEPSYAGSDGHDRCCLFLCPSQRVADRWRAKYPHVPAVAVGAPKMDAWHRRGPWVHQEGTPVTAAITFHSNNTLCDETVTAIDHYQPGLQAVIHELAAHGVKVIGHAHPRLFSHLRTRRFWENMGVEAVEDFTDVLARADILAVDNSSVGPEFASTGRPIVWMNAPWYRRDVVHGGRFWDWTDGIPTADHPDELPGLILEALQGSPDLTAAYKRMVDDVYVACDGQASARAAAAVLATVTDGTSPEVYAGRPR